MRDLATGGDVSADGSFYRHVDTVVCLHPGMPAGSKLDRFVHARRGAHGREPAAV